MKKIYILPEYVEKIFLNEAEVNSFILLLNNLYENLAIQKDTYQIKIILDIDKFDEWNVTELYDFKMLSSLYLDTFSFIASPEIPDDFNNYSVFKIPITNNSIIETKDKLHLALAHNIHSSSHVFNELCNDSNLLVLHNYNKEFKPKFVTIPYLDITVLQLELFFEKYIICLFKDNSKYQNFKSVYFEFSQSFNWQSWQPNSRPTPAHEILKKLIPLFKKNAKKNDASFIFWGHIMAILNGYSYNKELTMHNSKQKNVNDIFQSGIEKGNNTVFFSIDTENGNLEIYNYQGIHMNHIYGIRAGLRSQKRNYTIEVPKSKWL